MAFKTRKAACPLSGTPVHTVILRSDVQKQLLSQCGFSYKFTGQYIWVDSFLFLETSPDCSCSTERILPISRTGNSEFWRVFEWSLQECSVL